MSHRPSYMPEKIEISKETRRSLFWLKMDAQREGRDLTMTAILSQLVTEAQDQKLDTMIRNKITALENDRAHKKAIARLTWKSQQHKKRKR